MVAKYYKGYIHPYILTFINQILLLLKFSNTESFLKPGEYCALAKTPSSGGADVLDDACGLEGVVEEEVLVRLVLVRDHLDDLLRQDPAHDGGHGTQLGEEHRWQVLGHLALGKPELKRERNVI